jgi:plastin-1
LSIHPGLLLLLKTNETQDDFLNLSKEDILLRWMNYQLKKSSYTGPEIKNFSNDIKDSVAYTYLLHQIAPEDQQPPLTLNSLNVIF